MSFSTRGKAAVPYIVGGTKVTLDILHKGVKANRDDVKSLVERLLALQIVIGDCFKGKKTEEIREDIRYCLDRLTCQLKKILVELEELRSSSDLRTIKGFFGAILLYSDHSKKIQGYSLRINWAMQVFQVERRIKEALLFQDMREDLRFIRGRLENASFGPAVQDTLLLVSSVLPSKPLVLYGRDGEVEKIVRRILELFSPRLALLGPGGVGKTALALAIIEHPGAIEKFKNFRFFVRCEQATSASLLIDLLAMRLQIEKQSTNRMQAVTSLLSSIGRPVLLILDNFETPWDAKGEQSRVEEVLCALASLPHVALLITMRSHTPPSTHVSWSLPWLDPLSGLSELAARDLYLNVDPKAGHDGSLDELLEDLSYMPLAITLMASLGRSGESPETLLKVWRDKAVGTDLLSGGDKSKSVNVSIQLSIESNLMKNVPDALTLLSVIAMLPAGIDMLLLPALVPSIPNRILAKTTLIEATLAQDVNDTHILQILSPIRLYVSRHHPPPDHIRRTVYNAYTQFVLQHNSRLGDPDYHNDTRALAAEERNLEAILLQSVETGSCDAINAAIDFSWYLSRTRPRIEVITRAVATCRRQNTTNLLADSLYCFGSLLFRLERFDEAQVSFKEAFDLYGQLKNGIGSANCTRSLGEIYHIMDRYDEALGAYEDASRKYAEAADLLGSVKCRKRRGDVYWAQDRDDDALVEFEAACQQYKEVGDRIGLASCRRRLGDVHWFQGRYDTARDKYLEAHEAYEELGDRLGVANCLKGLGDVYRMQAHYGTAIEAYTQAIQTYHDLGNKAGEASCLLGLGQVNRVLQHFVEAEASVSHASVLFKELGLEKEVETCRRLLDVISCASINPVLGEAEVETGDLLPTYNDLCRTYDDVRPVEKPLQSITSNERAYHGRIISTPAYVSRPASHSRFV
ncbi:hypothetical protein FRB97_005690 [Tulasnella sp. 331]|nr:hypothetical protein FRB97_005690 [Tulasnella sp. 331]